MTEKKKHSELLSADVQEIIGYKPQGLVQYGNLIFLLLLMTILAGCWLIQYPDVVHTSAALVSVHAPKEVRTKTDGTLVKLFVHENKWVDKNEIIGFVESTARHESVIKLSQALETIQYLLDHKEPEIIRPLLREEITGLGELQSAYQTFNQALMQFSDYLPGGFYLRRKEMLHTDIRNLERLHQTLNAQLAIQEEDVKLSVENFEVEEKLAQENVISPLDYRSQKSKYLLKQLSLPQLHAAIISNEATQNEKRKEILELENRITQQRSIFRQALQTFTSHVEEWKKKYLLRAPVAGWITYASFLEENQYLSGNKLICFVTQKNTSFYAQTYIPQYNLGKIAIGQKVLLKFSSYSFQEYGSVQGRVEYISSVATDSGYLARIVLPHGLVTNHQQKLQFRNGLTAQCEIITHDMRLTERFYNNLVKEMRQ
jgi:multidrug efflux pump subunit AcrA (membrane-fusion protein)